MSVADRAKRVLVRLGGYVPAGQLVRFESVLTHLEMGRGFKDAGLDFSAAPTYACREDLYRALAGIARGRVLYVELGVSEGESMCAWSALLRDREATLHGFDSFRGLPEAWNGSPAGTYDAGGVVPTFDDDRVAIHVGLFDETLPGFELPSHDTLIVNLDADIYSSTRYALDMLHEAFRPGTILIFDEFNDRNHEWRAFREYLAEHPESRFRYLGGAWNGVLHCAFERVA